MLLREPSNSSSIREAVSLGVPEPSTTMTPGSERILLLISSMDSLFSNIYGSPPREETRSMAVSGSTSTKNMASGRGMTAEKAL